MLLYLLAVFFCMEVDLSHKSQDSMEAFRAPATFTPFKRPYSDTLEFLRKARELGVYDVVLSSVEGEKREDRTQIFLVADEYFNTPFSAKDLGEKYYFTESYVYRRRDIAVRLLHENSPEELKIQYPIEELRLAKPRTGWAKVKSSLARGTRVDKIIQSVETGATARGVMLEFGLTVEEASNRRRLLRELNINIPHQIVGLDIAREINEALKEPQLSNERAQELLNRVRTSFYRHNIGPSGCLMTLKELVDEAGLRYANNQTRYFEALAGKVPIAIVESQNDKKKRVSHKRRFLFRHDQKRALQVLREDQSLQHLKIK